MQRVTVTPPKLLRWLLPWVLWRVRTSQRVVFLTFDDGPTPGLTEWALEELGRYQARATFFVLGKHAEQYPEIIHSILQGGHSIGNHGYSHKSGWQVAWKDYKADIAKCDAVLHQRSGARPGLFRPPYGQFPFFKLPELLRQHRLVMWDVLAGDYDVNLTPAKCARNVLQHVRPGSILVLHDSLKAEINLTGCLPTILDELTRQGYRFEALQPCLK